MFIQVMANEEESGHGDDMALLTVLQEFDLLYPKTRVPRSNTIRKQCMIFTCKVSNTLGGGGGGKAKEH